MNQFNLKEPVIYEEGNGNKIIIGFTLKRNPSYLLINSFLPSLFTMLMTIVPLFLDDNVHFSTTITLVLTAQLCLYTLMQSSLEGIPKTEYLKMIDLWNLFVMTLCLANFFILFLWEYLQQKKIKNPIKKATQRAVPILALFGCVIYWFMAGLMYYEIF